MTWVNRFLPDGYRAALENTTFRRLLAAVAGSDLGDGMSFVAVSWLAIQIAPPGQAAPVVAAALTAYALPGAAGALLLARWLRRVDPRLLVTANAILRGTALGAVAALHLAGQLTPGRYVVLLAVSAVLSAWGHAGVYTLVSRIFTSDRRLPANTLLSTLQTTTIIIGPPLAGALVAVAGPGLVLAIDGLSFLLLAGTAYRIRTGTADDPADRRVTSSGFRLLARRPELVGLLVVNGLFFLLYGPVEVALPLYVADDLDRSAGFLGGYWAAYGIGAVLGGLAGGLLTRIAQWPFVIVVIAGWGLALLPFGLTTTVWVTMAGMAVGGLVYGPFPAVTLTLFQDAASPAELPAVLAARSAVTTAVVPLGTALGGPLVALLGADGTLFVSGLATIALAMAVALVLLATRRRSSPPTTSSGADIASMHVRT